MCRFDPPGDDKQIRPLIWGRHANGREDWNWASLPAPRPLFGLDRFAARLTAPVLIVEGEKAAEAAQALFPDHLVTTSPGGANAADQSDWSPLAGREVAIWPDHDHSGQNYARHVVRLAHAAGALTVRLVHVPHSWPERWDLAEALPEGALPDDLHDLLAAAEIIPSPPLYRPVSGYRMDAHGLWLLRDGEDPSWLSDPFEVLAETRASDHTNWGLRVRWRDRDGHVHERALPNALLAGDGNAVLVEFLDGGLSVAPKRSAREALLSYLMRVRVADRARAVDRIGWHGSTFVLPDETFSPQPIGTKSNEGPERVVLQTEAGPAHALRVSGTLADWQTDVAAPCRGNTRLVLGICTALAAPLVEIVGAESGGIHLRGPSSIGKTTALRVAGSVWGGGGTHGYIRSWRATDNGLEGTALAHCDALLCLDEISQIAPQAAAEVAYMLANGQGKTRAGRSGSARSVKEWRLLFLSTGEIGLADKIAEDSRSPRRLMAGQEVRVIDLPADAGAGLGTFEELHGFPSAQHLAEHLRQATARLYGRAVRAYLARFAQDLDQARAGLHEAVDQFMSEHCPDRADGQVRRVAQRFALLAAAGELAIALEVLPWPEGESDAALARCFADWLTARGGTEPAEVREIAGRLRGFIEAHGESRFSAWDDNAENGVGGRVTHDRVGFRRRSDQGWEYVVLPGPWKDKIFTGLDLRLVNRVLLEKGILVPDGRGRPQRTERLPGFGGSVRCYCLSPDLMEAGHEA